MLADNVLQKNLTAMADNPIRTWFWVTAKEDAGNRMSYFAIWFSNVTTLQLKTSADVTLSQGFGSMSVADELTPDRVNLVQAQAGGRSGMWRRAPHRGCISFARFGKRTTSSLQPLGTMGVQSY